jgi:type 1 fimbria pilin
MRTKILKFGMPLMAFLLAIVFAFATENKAPVDDTALVTGYITNPGSCDIAPKNCSFIPGTVCTYLGKTVHRNSNCSGLLYEFMR